MFNSFKKIAGENSNTTIDYATIAQAMLALLKIDPKTFSTNSHMNQWDVGAPSAEDVSKNTYFSYKLVKNPVDGIGYGYTNAEYQAKVQEKDPDFIHTTVYEYIDPTHASSLVTYLNNSGIKTFLRENRFQSTSYYICFEGLSTKNEVIDKLNALVERSEELRKHVQPLLSKPAIEDNTGNRPK